MFVKPGLRPSDMGAAAVLTGDVIASTSLARRAVLPDLLGEAFAAIERIEGALVRPFEIYRGDSFQGIVRPENALLAATILRSRLRSVPTRSDVARDRIDARIAIGIGAIEHALDRVVESDGEAFRSSGRALDEMTRSKEGRRLRVESASAGIGSAPDLAAQLLDAIVARWTRPAAEVAYAVLSEPGIKQRQIAERLQVSQPAVSQRLKAARFQEVEKILTLYEHAVRGRGAG
jgi:hypothetical protein